VNLLEPHPDPPSDLHQRQLPLLAAPGPWIRSHSHQYQPLYFGTSGFNRFDAQARQYGVLYAASDVRGAFIETFGRELGQQTVPMAKVAARTFSRIIASRPLRFVDLTGPGLNRIGADNRLSTGDYQISQRWALALYEHPEQPDGLLYRSRHDPDRVCAAIFDRAAQTLTADSLGSLADPVNAGLLADILNAYNLGLIP
jgi:RES domain